MILKDKVVIISGIGPGLGIKLALGAAQEGASAVVLASRSADKLDQAEALIRDGKYDCQVLKVPTDITDKAQCTRLVEETVKAFGRIDGLINSAYNPGDLMEGIESSPPENWREVIETNVFGTMNLSLAAAQQMKTQEQGGAMVMINSMVTRKPLRGQGVYAASKGALGVAAKYLAHELGQYGIRVNTVSMGWMWGTPVENYMKYIAETQNLSVEQQLAAVTANIPLGRMPTDEQCAKAALFMASDYSTAVTGAWLDANGGEFMAQ